MTNNISYILLGKFKDQKCLICCPYMNQQNQLCTSKSYDITNLRMLLPVHMIDRYINSLLDYIHQTESNKNDTYSTHITNMNQNHRLINQQQPQNNDIHDVNNKDNDDDNIDINLVTIIQELIEALNIQCPQCQRVLDPTPDGCCAVRYLLLILYIF